MMHRFSKLAYVNILPRLCYNRIGLHVSIRNCTLFKQEEKNGLKHVKNIDEERSMPMMKKISKNNAQFDFLNIHSLLKKATSHDSANKVFEALDTLARWHQTNEISFQDIENDVNYPKLKNILFSKASNRPERELTKAIEDLSALGVPSDHFLIETLENDLLWSVSRVPLIIALHIFSFQVRYQMSEKQKKVLEIASAEIKRRWSELKYAYEYCSLYSLSSHFDANLLNQVDERLMEYLEHMGTSDMSRIFVAVSTSKRRPIPLLRSLAFHMFKRDDKFTLKQIVGILYAMNSKSFVDESLLVKLSSDFLAQVEDITDPSIVRSVLQCMGQMRWREKAIINAISDWMINNMESCRNNEIVSLILTLAVINYKPDNFEELISLCMSKLNLNDESCDKFILIDIAWSLMILGKASNELVSRILNHTFISGIPIYDPPRVGVCIKLLNINAAANTIMESYEGEKLHLPFFDRLLLTQSRRDLAVHEQIFKILHNFLPPNKYIKEHVNTDMGFAVDAEIIMNLKNQPLIVSDYSTAFGTVESPNPLPEGARRIALMIWGYRDYTIGDQSILGQNRLACELLEKRGYKVVQIPYFDINRKDKTLKGIQYFERKFREM